MAPPRWKSHMKMRVMTTLEVMLGM